MANDVIDLIPTPDYECQDCIGMIEHGCYCQAMGATQPGGPAALAATPAVGGEARKWIIDLIHNEYDPKPSDYRPGDNWNDGAEEIADQILERLRNV